MADDFYVPQERTWDQNDWHMVFIVLVATVSFLFSTVFWFTWLFGGSPQRQEDLLNYIVAATLIAALPGAVMALIAASLPMQLRWKISYILAALSPPILYSGFQAIRLVTAS